MTTPDGAQLVVGDVEWLDGLGVHLPGPAHSPPAVQTELSNCAANIGITAGIEQKLASQGSKTEVSVSCMNTMPQDKNENMSFQQKTVSCPKRKHKSDECCNELFGGGEAAMDQICPDVPCYSHGEMQTASNVTKQPGTANDQCKLLMMDSSPEMYACQQLEQPSFLVLAAGVLNEPGRLFTLWWAQSRHTHKCKKE